MKQPNDKDGKSEESNLIKYLRQFNRKERFILLSKVCGTFRIDPSFARCLEKCLKLPRAIPCDAFVAMDYHLDWLQMALYFDKKGLPDNALCNKKKSGSRLFEANQQDIDTLIAFCHDGSTHLILIEAKADTAWDWKQLESKSERIKQIFGKKGTNYSSVCPWFVLMSPKEPSDWKDKDWLPQWMRRGVWLKLALDEGVLKATRCNGNGENDKDGDSLYLSDWKNDRWEKRQ